MSWPRCRRVFPAKRKCRCSGRFPSACTSVATGSSTAPAYLEDDPENPGKKRAIYQEIKCGAVFWQDPKEQWHKPVVSGRDEPQRFGLCLWQLAVQCGLLLCPEVIFISDGGTWCNTVAESYFKDATRI